MPVRIDLVRRCLGFVLCIIGHLMDDSKVTELHLLPPNFRCGRIKMKNLKGKKIPPEIMRESSPAQSSIFKRYDIVPDPEPF